jgi:hypothetical protein
MVRNCETSCPVILKKSLERCYLFRCFLYAAIHRRYPHVSHFDYEFVPQLFVFITQKVLSVGHWATYKTGCYFQHRNPLRVTCAWSFVFYTNKNALDRNAALLFPDLTGSQWARGSVVSWGTMLQAERSWLWVPMRWIFSIYLILPPALWPRGRLSL